MKRVKSKGHSAFWGNAPSQYHKYNKKPHKYGPAVQAVYDRAAREGGKLRVEHK